MILQHSKNWYRWIFQGIAPVRTPCSQLVYLRVFSRLHVTTPMAISFILLHFILTSKHKNFHCSDNHKCALLFFRFNSRNTLFWASFAEPPPCRLYSMKPDYFQQCWLPLLTELSLSPCINGSIFICTTCFWIVLPSLHLDGFITAHSIPFSVSLVRSGSHFYSI